LENILTSRAYMDLYTCKNNKNRTKYTSNFDSIKVSLNYFHGMLRDDTIALFYCKYSNCRFVCILFHLDKFMIAKRAKL